MRVNDDAAGPRQVEPMVTVDPGNPAHLVLVAEESDNRDGTTTRVRVWVSDDAGQTWRTTGLLPGQNAYQGNPSVSYCADGTLFAALQDINPTTIFQVYRSTDGGDTWERRTPAQQQTSGLDLPLLICDDTAGPCADRLYLRYVSVGKISVVRSLDGALTWSSPVPVGNQLASNFPGEMAIAANGTLWLGWVKNTSPSQIRTARSTDGGASFGPTEIVGPVTLVPSVPKVDYRRTSRPSLGVDRSGGSFHGGAHVVFGDWLGTESDVKYSRRPPGASVWFPPVRLNDDTAGNGKDQDFPLIRVDPLGVVRAIWFDHRNDPGDGSIEVYAITSRDFGQTFEASYPISAEPFLAPTGSGAFLGDHLGIATWPHVFLAAWPDRNRDDGDILVDAVRDFPFEEIAGVAVGKTGGTEICWTSQDPTYGAATVYDVIGGNLEDLRADQGFGWATCLAEDVPDTPWQDVRPDPLPGNGYYYLVRSQQGADASSWGASSAPPDRRLSLDVAGPCQ